MIHLKHWRCRFQEDISSFLYPIIMEPKGLKEHYVCIPSVIRLISTLMGRPHEVSRGQRNIFHGGII